MAPMLEKNTASEVIKSENYSAYLFVRQGHYIAFEKWGHNSEDIEVQWKKIARKYDFDFPDDPDDKGVFRLDKKRKTIIIGDDERDKSDSRYLTISRMSKITEPLGVKTFSFWEDHELLRLSGHKYPF